MISLFEKNLKRMQQELTDLKTVHQRGLGTIRFFKYEFDFATQQNHKTHYIKADIVAGEPEKPFIQCEEKGDPSSPITAGDYDIDSGTSVVTIGIYVNRYPSTFKLIVTSTSELTNWRLDHVG